MSIWNKKQVSKTDIEALEQKYGIDALTASILLRRGITSGQELLYYMEDDLRFQHSPFSFSTMEDAVDRINDAQEEKEKVLIFGDRDVDGVSSTTVLYDCLAGMGIDVQYRLPSGDDTYGLSLEAVDSFAKEGGSLIITVDCGISNNAEVAHAGELGLDVIIVDHHNAPAELPSPAIIVNPKCPDAGYPFRDISGCAVVYKLVSAIRFSQSRWYKQQVTLLHAMPSESESALTISCIKLRNLVPVSRLDETVVPGAKSITETRLPAYLEGELILVWDAQSQRRILAECFGTAVDINLFDVQPEAARLFPQFAGMPLAKLKSLSKIARYGNHAPTEIGGFYNIYVTYVQQQLKKEFPAFAKQEEKDLQLVALAALADIMPMRDENRIFVKKGIESINAGHPRQGLLELMAQLNMLGKRISSTDVSWTIVSNLNAAGRLGHPELAAQLFISPDAAFRESAARRITELNGERKQLSADAYAYAELQAKTSIPLHNGKLCVVIDERINRGVSGILAGRLVSAYNIPAMTITFVEGTAIGSMRSCRGFDVTAFLNKMDDIFLNHGGHTFAGGFSFERSRLAEFEARVKELSAGIELEETKAGTFDVDAEIPPAYLTPNLLTISDSFEPFGEENAQLLFMTKQLPVLDAIVMGKGAKQHLKITVGNGTYKWPALFWNEGERLHRDFEVGDSVDLLFHVDRNTFNGAEIPQLIIVDMLKSKSIRGTA
ncbi:MAG TPA: single-stranded-DNA-specific exonuclease RecJ [Treponema sp.]|nr:single-stranded-DNA-specific exonuclease RecJ [Treponema sp.]